MEKDTAQKLDLRIRRAGFASRTDFFTAVSRAALGEASETLDESLRDWINTQTPAQTSDLFSCSLIPTKLLVCYQRNQRR